MKVTALLYHKHSGPKSSFSFVSRTFDATFVSFFFKMVVKKGFAGFAPSSEQNEQSHEML